MFILASVFVLTILSTSAAAVNGTGHTTNKSIDLTSDCSGSDPIINGTVTVNEYGHVRPLEGATVIANSTGGKVLGSTTTDANGHYTITFYSTETTFNIIASYIGCNPITKSVTVTNGANYPTDPNKYGTADFQLTPKTATLTSTGNGQSVYIQGQNKDGFAGVINVRVDGRTYTAYCIDLFTPISIGDTLLVNGPLPGTAGDLPSEVEWDKVSYILNHYNPSSDNEAAAIQCAIWYFTSVQYGAYDSSAPVGTYYQYMTAPRDGVIRNWWSDDTTVRNRALAIINEVNSLTIPSYPNSVTVTPETTTVANGQTVTITATVRDINGNPLQGVTVNFQRTSGSLSRTSGTTDANGQVSTVLTLNNNSNSVVTAYVSGNYGNLLYDDQYATVREQNLVARNVLPLTISAFSIIKTTSTANVALTQTATTPANVGDTVTYTVTATNNGPSTATGILISDIVPAGLSGVTVTPSVGTYYNGVWTIPTLANGASATLRITGTATAAMAGLTNNNTATRTSQEQYNSQPTTTTAGVYTKLSDPIITQTVNGQSTGTVNVNVGDDVTIVVNAYCSGPDDATNIQIRDIVPAGLTNVTVTPSVGTYDSNTGIWTIPFLEKFTSATLTITGKAGTSMAGTNTTNNAVEIFQTEYNPQPGNSTSIPVYTKMANVTISQTINGENSATTNIGDTVTYVISVVNNGPDAATNLKITDLLPNGLTDISYITGSGSYNVNTGIWDIGTLNSLTSTTLTITAKITSSLAGITTTNFANITSQNEYNPSPPTSNTKTYTLISPDISIGTYAYSRYNEWYYNVQVPFIVYVKNNSSEEVKNVIVEIKLPQGIELLSTNLRNGGTCYYNAETRILTWILENVPGKSAPIFEYTVANRATGTSTINTTVYAGTTSKYVTWDIVTPASADVQVTQTSNNNNPQPGDIITITITAKNNGPNNGQNIYVNYQIPSGLTLYGTNPITQTKGTYSNNQWNIGNLDNQETATLTLTLQVNTDNTIISNAYTTRISTTTNDWTVTNNGQTIYLITQT